jgi:archaellum component FlaC
VLAMVVAFASNGFFVPTTIIVDDTCSNQEFFQNSVESYPGYLASVMKDKPPMATCSACDYANLFVGWNEFNQAASNLTTDNFKLHPNESGQPAQSAEESQLSVMQSFDVMKQVEQLIANANISDVPRRVVWEKQLSALNRMAEASGDNMMKKVASDLQETSDALVANSKQLVQSFEHFRSNYTSLMKIVNELRTEWNKTREEALNEMKGSVQNLQNNLNEAMKRYIPSSVKADCGEAANATVDNKNYESFQTALCGNTLVGLEVTWIMQVVIAVILIPLIVNSLKGYKLLGFARILEETF